MHSTAIFLGSLVFGWGAHGLGSLPSIIRGPGGREAPLDFFWDRLALHVATVVTLLLPPLLAAGGGALVCWGFRAG